MFDWSLNVFLYNRQAYFGLKLDSSFATLLYGLTAVPAATDPLQWENCMSPTHHSKIGLRPYHSFVLSKLWRNNCLMEYLARIHAWTNNSPKPQATAVSTGQTATGRQASARMNCTWLMGCKRIRSESSPGLERWPGTAACGNWRPPFTATCRLGMAIPPADAGIRGF